MAAAKKTKPKVKATPKEKAAVADVKPAADAPAEAKVDAPAADAPKTDAPKTDAPKSYSRGEGQKVVTQAYKDNWNAIYGKKKR